MGKASKHSGYSNSAAPSRRRLESLPIYQDPRGAFDHLSDSVIPQRILNHHERSSLQNRDTVHTREAPCLTEGAVTVAILRGTIIRELDRQLRI